MSTATEMGPRRELIDISRMIPRDRVDKNDPWENFFWAIESYARTVKLFEAIKATIGTDRDNAGTLKKEFEKFKSKIT